MKITNPNFLPIICRFVEQYKVKTIGWSPGGNVPASTVRQLWMADGTVDGKLKYIDSRHLYLNHMDPLESVVTIFNRAIGDKERGDKSLLGGEICVWNDRAVSRQEDILSMNPVYPAMLAFAERSWQGGGKQGWTATIGAPGSTDELRFTKFENRLLDHQQENFATLPFLYHKQASITWSFYGPYNNNGTAGAEFKPEQDNRSLNDSAAFKATGGTIVLRHWWYPLIQGVINDPKENTTWYAKTTIWSDHDGRRNFWIGFNNFSRSTATDTPEPGTWDNRKSAVWVNGTLIAPPNWKHAGQKGDMEVPLIDEGYEYRPPTCITLKKGWNTIGKTACHQL